MSVHQVRGLNRTQILLVGVNMPATTIFIFREQREEKSVSLGYPVRVGNPCLEIVVPRR